MMKYLRACRCGSRKSCNRIRRFGIRGTGIFRTRICSSRLSKMGIHRAEIRRTGIWATGISGTRIWATGTRGTQIHRAGTRRFRTADWITWRFIRIWSSNRIRRDSCCSSGIGNASRNNSSVGSTFAFDSQIRKFFLLEAEFSSINWRSRKCRLEKIFSSPRGTFCIQKRKM